MVINQLIKSIEGYPSNNSSKYMLRGKKINPIKNDQNKNLKK